MTNIPDWAVKMALDLNDDFEEGLHEPAIDAIALALVAVRNEERERCAQMIEKYKNDWLPLSVLAYRIRTPENGK